VTLHLAEIRIHPVKSLAGLSVEAAEVDDRGLRHDRRFMVVDPRGRFITQRELPAMATVRAFVEDECLVLEAPSGATFALPVEGGGEPLEVTIWRDRVAALDQGADAARWLNETLGADLRLVRMPPETHRPVDPAYARAGDRVSFADGFPFLLVTEASLAALNERSARPVDVRRFRPNLVIAGATPFAEDGWTEIGVGPVRLFPRKACSRCQVVDVDPDRGVREKGTLATLSTFRREGSRVLFGQNLVHDGRGVIRRGDLVTVR